MKTLSQIIKGLIVYIQTVMIPSMPAGHPKRFAVDFAVSYMSADIESLCNKVRAHPYYENLKRLGFINENDTVDISEIAPLLCETVKRNGLDINLPIVGVISIDENDVDQLVKIINGV